MSLRFPIRIFVQETLRARVHGTIPDRMLRKALALKKEKFQQYLADKGLTYREYRIAHRVKPQEVEDRLYDEAFDELSTDIALDLVFTKQELSVGSDDMGRTLAELAPEGKKTSTKSSLPQVKLGCSIKKRDETLRLTGR